MIRITGKVIYGDSVGKRLGFPTANLDRRGYSRQKIKARLGIYAGWADIGPVGVAKSRFKAAIVIGPIDKRRLPKIEAHIIGFSGNLYGKKVSIELHKYIRPFRNFSSQRELKNQIRKDIKKAKAI